MFVTDHCLRRLYYMRIRFATILLVLASLGVQAQNYYLIQGYVTDEDARPMPGVTIRIQGTGGGTVTNDQGQYSLRVEEGYHRLIFSYMGYASEKREITVQQQTVLNVVLKELSHEIEAVQVSKKRRDPAYEIIQQVVAHRDLYRNQYRTQRCEIYVKSTETKTTKTVVEKDDKEADGKQESESKDTTAVTSLFEASFIQHKEVPNGFKEEKIAAKKLGSQSRLFFTSTSMADFDFLDNLLYIQRLGDNSYVSPFSSTGILSYKFKLLRSYFEANDQKVYVIKVIPRKAGNALFRGEVEVWDSSFALKQVDLSVAERSLIRYDAFALQQRYMFVEDRWVLSHQEFTWKVMGKNISWDGKSTVRYTKYSFDSTYHKRFFNAEIGIARGDAYEKDTAFWEAIRPIKLTSEEREFIEYKDSIYRRLHSKEYLDSVDSAYNKITLAKVLWHGFGHFDREKKTHWSFAPLPALLDPLAIGGWRVRYNFAFFKRFDSTRRSFYVAPMLNYGFRNRDVKGSLNGSVLYNPMKRSRINYSLGSYFGVVNGFATFADLLRRDNFYENNFAALGHRTELFNGFYVSTSAQATQRRDLGDFKFSPAGDSLFPDNNPTLFDSHSAFEFTVGISYTPRQLYLQEPKEKIILGSAWPSFSLRYTQAVPNLFNTSSSFKYIEASIAQEFNIGVAGRSEYSISYGRFLDTTKLRVMDYRYQRGGDPYIFMPAMYGFQYIDSSFATFDGFLEAHYQHQFNGFITSKIPGLKQLNIRTVAGAGFLVVPERDYQYSELFGGLNRIFKLGNQRMRIGMYYIVAQSNTQGFTSGFKFSLEPYNNSTDSWSF